ncbi:MAG: haloacid dehalogenase type II [Planctomycetes bacterium]|nr:haloacid dehalogenase type II [Planctomycetota bacterium]
MLERFTPLPDPLASVEALTFDLFGTVLDLGGSLRGPIDKLLRSKGAATSAEAFWAQWRARQRIEQYQDTIVMLGHSGYLETARRALVYTLGLNHVEFDGAAVDRLMSAWQQLSPFPEVAAALQRLQERYRLVALSNGNRPFLDHLVANRIGHPFDEVISVDVVGAFKPHPAVYRRAARILTLEPRQCLMVSANSFDVMGARACGFRAAFVNRLALPYEDSPYRPDVTVDDFTQLASALLGG